jgi:hypothetical protein
MREGLKQTALQVVELHDDVVVRARQRFAFQIDPEGIDREATVDRGGLERVGRSPVASAARVTTS